MRGLIALHDTYVAYVKTLLRGRLAVPPRVEGGVRGVLQQDHLREHLRGAHGDVLRQAPEEGRLERLSDEAIEETLEKVVRLLAYVSDKDLFGEFYRKKLSKRLLFDQSANDDHERSILAKLKHQCGAQFTSKMEGMVTDPAARARHAGVSSSGWTPRRRAPKVDWR